MNNRLQLGRWGEALAADHLRGRGYRVVERNFRTRLGEIDLIAEKQGFIIFVEVKLRANERFGEAREFVGRRKQERLRNAALEWLAAHETSLQPRFDVVEVYAPHGAQTPAPKIRHLENAF